MRILAGVMAMTVLAGCQMELPAFGAAKVAPDDAALVAMVSDATGTQVSGADVTAGEGEGGSAQAQDLAAAFEQAATPAPERKGLFAFLKAAPPPSPLEGTDIEVIASAGAQEAETAAATAGNGGIFAFLKPKAAAGVSIDAVPQAAAPDGAADVDVAAVSPDAAAPEVRPETVGVAPDAPAPTEPAPIAQPVAQPAAPARKGLFAGLFANTGARAAGSKHAGAHKTQSTVQPGEVLPFGVVGIACEAKPAAQGELVDKFPREGRAVWKLYDTDPASTGARTQFITGFDDKCPRQITASLVMFGSAALHEVHRYAKARKDVSWSEADAAYEVIKAKSCGVGKGVGCPAARLPALEHSMAFVSVYKTFGGSGDWLELLLADGALVTDQIR